MPVIGANLAAVRARIEAAASAAGRASDAVTLVAVSKTHPTDAVRAALAAGQRVFGENRVQERSPNSPGCATIFRSAAAPDRAIADQQGQGCRRPLRCHRDRRPAPPRRGAGARDGTECRRLPCFIEVNTGEEPQKAGVFPEKADAFVADCRDRLGLKIVGLMCIPPDARSPSCISRCCARLPGAIASISSAWG